MGTRVWRLSFSYPTGVEIPLMGEEVVARLAMQAVRRERRVRASRRRRERRVFFAPAFGFSKVLYPLAKSSSVDSASMGNTVLSSLHEIGVLRTWLELEMSKHDGDDDISTRTVNVGTEVNGVPIAPSKCRHPTS